MKRRLTFQAPVPSDPYRLPLTIVLIVLLVGYTVVGLGLWQYAVERGVL